MESVSIIELFNIYEYRKFYDLHFFQLIRFLPEFGLKYNLDWQKERGVSDPSNSDSQKVIQLEIWFLTLFHAKIVPISPFKLNNFFVFKMESSLNPRFFGAQALHCVKFHQDRTVSKKKELEAKNFWYSYQVKNCDFLNLSYDPVLCSWNGT